MTAHVEPTESIAALAPVPAAVAATASDAPPDGVRTRRTPRRRWDDLPLRTKALWVVTIPVAPLILSAVLFVAGARSARSAQEWVSHTLEAKATIATVLSLMVDGETGVRGFLLTRDAEALAPFDNATAMLPSEVARLEALIADNPVQGEHLKTLRVLMSARPLTRMIGYGHQHPDAPPPVALVRESRTTLNAIRTELAQMQQVEDVLLAGRVVALRVANRRLVAVGVIAALLGLSGSLIATHVFTAGIARRVDRVAENASRLAAGSALAPLVTAHDEVGHLDRRLHEAADLLHRSDEQLRRHVREQAALNVELELARRELDQFFSLSLDLMGIAGADGRFQRVNSAWKRTLGWTDKHLTSTPYLDFVHPDDRAATASQAAALAAGGLTVSFENRLRAADGSYRWLSWSTVATPERGLQYVAARDISEQISRTRSSSSATAPRRSIISTSAMTTPAAPATTRRCCCWTSRCPRSTASRCCGVSKRIRR